MAVIEAEIPCLFSRTYAPNLLTLLLPLLLRTRKAKRLTLAHIALCV